MNRERWAQLGITIQFLIVVRSLAEIFRLKYFQGSSFSVSIAMPYVLGALIAAGFCWASVTLYFFRRYRLAAFTALATVLFLLAYKMAAIGR